MADLTLDVALSHVPGTYQDGVPKKSGLAESIVEPVLEDLRAAQQAILEHPFKDEQARIQFAMHYLGQSEDEVRQALGEMSLRELAERIDPSYKALHRAADLRRTRLKLEILGAFKKGAKALDRDALRAHLMGLRTAEEAGHAFHGNQYTDSQTRIDKMMKGLEIAKESYATAFLLPDGTRRAFDPSGPFHQTTLGKRGYIMRDALQLGVIRYAWPLGVEVGQVPSEKQTQVIVDDWRGRRTGEAEFNVDVRRPVDGALLGTKKFNADEISADTIRQFVKTTLEKDIRTAEAVGHPFHGNQYTDEPGPMIAVQIPGGPKIFGTPEAQAAVKKVLDTMPAKAVQEAAVKKINAFTTQHETSKQIDDYLLKHYGITSDMQAKGLYDTDRQQIFVKAGAHETAEQLSQSFDHRVSSAEWQRLAHERDRDPNELFRDAFMSAFATVGTMASPITVGIEGAIHLFQKWGWLGDASHH